MSNDNLYIQAKQAALKKYFSRMNDEQQQAVFTVNGAVLILAGAGSGKTTVLVNRIANMIHFGNAYADTVCPASVTDEDVAFLNDYAQGKSDDSARLRDVVAVNPVKPYSILAITFTNKAAGELKDRLAKMLGDEGVGITAATFHSACARILRSEIDRLGYSKSFTIYDSDDSQRVIKNCLSELDISDKNFPPKSVASLISAAKDRMITPEMMEQGASGDYRKITVARVYALYTKKLFAASALDFDDILCLTVRLFEEFPDVLDHYQNRYKYIMVDEYQDTNHVQYRLVSLLSKKYGNLCVVGDDDQSIYKFRGATIENILSFEEQFDSCTVIRLEHNYRSTQTILSAANSVIKNNAARKDKKLWTDLGDGEKIVLFKGADESAESKFVATTILKNIKDGMSYRDHAVLYRMNAQSNSLERAFTNSGIPYRVIGGLRFYDRKEIKDIVAYLSVINNHNDVLRFHRIVNEPKRGIGDATISMLEQISGDLGLSPIEVMKNCDSYPLLSKKTGPLKSLAKTFEELVSISETEPLDKLLDVLLDKSGYRAAMMALGDEGITRMENIEELKSSMVTYSQETEEPTLSGFLEEISLYTDIDKLDADADAVCMMTVHSAKGLEFEQVFLVGMEDGIFPSARSASEPEELEEERRLLYVAITRAKRMLYITHAEQRMMFGQTTRNFTSRFIKEIDGELVNKIDNRPKNRRTDKESIVANAAASSYTLQSQIASQKAAAIPKNINIDFEVGERVTHNIFGDGTVLSVRKMANDAMLEVAFDKVGTKKLMANYARIKKL